MLPAGYLPVRALHESARRSSGGFAEETNDTCQSSVGGELDDVSASNGNSTVGRDEFPAVAGKRVVSVNPRGAAECVRREVCEYNIRERCDSAVPCGFKGRVEEFTVGAPCLGDKESPAGGVGLAVTGEIRIDDAGRVIGRVVRLVGV